MADLKVGAGWLGRRSDGCLMHVLPGTTAPSLLSVDEVAEYLGYKTDTVLRHVRRGTIPGRKVGGRWYIRVVDLEAMFAPSTLLEPTQVSA